MELTETLSVLFAKKNTIKKSLNKKSKKEKFSIATSPTV